MDLTQYQHTESVEVRASAASVYDLVSDITRMGEWSPECTGGAWLDEDRQWFTGSNTRGERSWETRCRVDVVVPGEEFTFTNLGPAGDVELVRWSYRLAPTGEGCRVTEVWEVLPAYVDFMSQYLGGPDAVATYLDGVAGPTREGMAQTLARLKAAAEG